MPQEKTKVYTYTRVFTAMQIDGYSLDAQKARMKAYADFNDTRSSANMRMPVQRSRLSKRIKSQAITFTKFSSALKSFTM